MGKIAFIKIIKSENALSNKAGVLNPKASKTAVHSH